MLEHLENLSFPRRFINLPHTAIPQCRYFLQQSVYFHRFMIFLFSYVQHDSVGQNFQIRVVKSAPRFSLA